MILPFLEKVSRNICVKMQSKYFLAMITHRCRHFTGVRAKSREKVRESFSCRQAHPRGYEVADDLPPFRVLLYRGAVESTSTERDTTTDLRIYGSFTRNDSTRCVTKRMRYVVKSSLNAVLKQLFSFL